MYSHKSNPSVTTYNYSLYAELYDAIYFDNDKFEEEMKYLSTPSESYILDVGCGTGDRVGRVSNAVGVDRSKSMLAVAKKKYPNKMFVQGDVLQKDLFSKDTFTEVWCLGNTIYCLPQKLSFFQHVYTWLDKEGTLVLQITGSFCRPSPYPKNFVYKLKKLGNTCREILKHKKQKAVVETKFYPESATTIKTMLERVGFTHVKTENNNIYFYKKSGL
jgi:ubiquinone/menaquinone biosynthesis C-methylase UbiE